MGGYRIATIGGIDVRVHASWAIIALLVVWSLFNRFMIGADRGVAATAVMAIVGTLLFFGSVLAHELAHSLEARRRGVDVHGITLFLFGGATQTSSEIQRPGDEFALTAIGPFTSFVLAAAFGLVATYAGQGSLAAVSEVAGYLGWINLALGVFNLLPGAPLDGGRILRSLVWKLTGDRDRANRVAARSGQVLGGVLALLGLLQLFTAAQGFGGLWLVFIGWFLASAATRELRAGPGGPDQPVDENADAAERTRSHIPTRETA